MMRRLLRAAIQNATVTRSEGLTLRIDPVILRAANILPLEELEIVHHPTGEQFTTFAEPGEPGQVSAPRVRAGDVISILSWGMMHDGQTVAHRALVVTLDASNTVVAIAESVAN
jgi:aspartate 1-decarboxylase